MSKFALDEIQAQLPKSIATRYVDRSNAEWAVIHKSELPNVMKFVKEKLGFTLFGSIDAVDRLHLPENDPRFEVVYFVTNIEKNERLHIKVLVSEDDCKLPSIRHIYAGANWAERLTWDFYGIVFENHNDLRRMLLYEEFVGHPLRKDYAMRDRQPLIPERQIKDIFRGPGTNGVAT